MHHFKSREAGVVLSAGQTDSQVVASSGKLNLRRNLFRVAKRTSKFPYKFTQVAKKPLQNPSRLICNHHALFHSFNLGVTQLALTWVR